MLSSRAAQRPLFRVDCAYFLTGPAVKMLAKKTVYCRCIFFSGRTLCAQLIKAYGNAKVRIRFNPNLFVIPTVALVNGGDKSKQPVAVFKSCNALKNSFATQVLGVPDTLPVVTRRCNRQHKGLPPRHCGFVQHVIQLTVRM